MLVHLCAFVLERVPTNFIQINISVPITVATPSVLGRSNAGIVGSNPTRGMDDCIVCFYFAFVLFCV
jgi:hypothetical protein